MPRKPIPLKVQKKLLLLSGNICCFPECTEKLYNLEDDVLVGEMCHITPVNSQGPRHENSTRDTEIDTYDNLIMMCPTHHKIIDTNTEKYTIEELKGFKITHEQKYYKYSKANEERIIDDSDIEKELSKLEQVFASKENIKLPDKKQYPKTPKYIERNLTSVLKEEDELLESLSLIEILDKHDKITILGVAGTGKSFELDKLANFYSEIEGGLYPIKVRLNLISNTDLETYLKIEYNEIDNIPQEQRLILLDALDEVHSDYIDLVSNNIALFGKTYPKSKIIVSCRNNLFITETINRSSKIENFKTYFLNPLRHGDISKYINDNVNSQDDFNQKLKNFGLFGLLESPFYLITLVDYYNKKKDIPKSKKEIFEYLINERFTEDLNKYKTAGLKINNYQNKIELIIEDLAFIVQSLGRNYLNEKEEFHKIVPDPQMLEIVNRTFLFNKTNTNKWMFEHNNFQEYLAAKRLSRFGFNLIQNIISFPGNKKIKPFWVNTLSFLFSILDHDNEVFINLFNWINNIEADVLIRFEKDKLEIKTREVIFNKIFSDYENKNIRIGNEKFNSVDLAKFVSDSDNTLLFLVEKSKKDNDFVSLTEKIVLFTYFDNVNNYKKQITELLLSKICDKNISNKIKYYCLGELAILRIFSKQISETILSHINFDTSKYARTGFYSYILQSDHLDDYINLYIKGIEHIKKSNRVISGGYSGDDEDVSLSDEEYTLERILQKIENANSIKLLLNSLLVDDGYNSFYFDLAKQLLIKSIALYNSGEYDLSGYVVKLLFNLSHNHNKSLDKEILSFFEATNTISSVFEILYDRLKTEPKLQYDLLSSLAKIVNDEIINRLIHDAQTGVLTDDQIYQIRNILSFDRRDECFEKFYSAICNKDLKFKYLENTFETRKKERVKRDSELLFNKTEFIKEIEGVFSIFNKTILTRDELFDFKGNNFTNLSNNIVLDTLRLWSRETEGSVELNYVLSIVNDETKWLWFKLHKLVDYDKNNKQSEFNEVEENFIKEWVSTALTTADFATAVELKDDKRINYRYSELFIVYFTERLSISLTEQDYLNFIYVDCHLVPYKQINDSAKKEDRLIADFVIERIGFEKTKSKVLENMKILHLYNGVRKSYFDFCVKYKVYESVEFAFNEIIRDNLSIYEKRKMVDIYLGLDGQMSELESIIDTVPEELRMYIIEKLIEYKSTTIKQYSLNELSRTNDEQIKIKYIQFLLKMEPFDSFVYLKEWILKNKQIPNIKFYKLMESDFQDLIEIYTDCLKYNYGNGGWSDSKDIYLSQLIEVGSKNETLYLKTRQTLEFWISSFEKSQYLHYTIQKLDQLYYSNISQALTFEDIKEIMNPSK